MTSNATARAAGTFKIGGKVEVNRLGFGAMRITGKGVWGPPHDKAEALRILRRLPEIGVNFIDTADSYGPDVSEQLIREALHPYGALTIVTKAGLTRPGPDHWLPNGSPDYLIAQTKRSLRKLGVERIDLWLLHRIDSRVPRDEQFGAVRQLLDEGLIAQAGLSQVSVDDAEAASKHFKVAAVQNRYNLTDRGSEDVLNYCEANAIGFIPWYPLAAGALAKPGSKLDDIAGRLGATRSQVALAWLLRRSPVMLPIPGTARLAHLEENVAAAGLELPEEDFTALSAQAN